jgi:anti-sigma-K factor RskA
VTNCDDVQQLADLYVLGALPLQEAEEVETHLESCADCRAEVRRAWDTGQLLRLAVPTVEPPDTLRYRILAAARADLDPAPAPSPRPVTVVQPARRGWFSWLSAPRLAGALAVIPLVLSLWLTTQVLSMQRQIQDTERALARTAQNAVSGADILSKAMDGGASMTRLVGADGAPSSWGKLYYLSSTNEGVLVVYGLPKQGDDKVYQAWLMSSGRANSAGTFYCEETGRGMLVIRSTVPLQDAEMLRITKEPRGGSDQPHEPSYLWGRLRNT